MLSGIYDKLVLDEIKMVIMQEYCKIDDKHEW